MDRPGITEAGADCFRVIDEYTEYARQYHAEHGVWPPDPLLDEVADMRRQIMAENGNDWRKVLQWHLDQDRLHRQQHDGEKMPAIEENSPAVSGR
ncbi:MAG TPA: hypothetical protein VK358_18000 [Longimicrobium sp.]|nr:hypothetical protein [Longimicrobium sp.]